MTKKEPPKPAWRLYAHPAFSKPFDALVAEVTRLRKNDPSDCSAFRERSCSSALSILWKRKFRAIRTPRNTILATRLVLRTVIGAA